MITKSSDGRQLIKNIIFTIFVVAVFFMLLEFAARLFIVFVRIGENEEVIYTALPPKQKNEFRVFLYGGSVVEGEPEPTVSFAAQLQFFLKKIYGEKIKVYNFGAAGMASSYIRETLYVTIRNDPDVIIVMLGHNEFLNPKVYFPQLLSKLISRSALIRVMDRCFIFGYTKLFEKAAILSRAHRDIIFDAKIMVYRKNIEKIIQIAKRKNIPLLFGTLPYNMLWAPVSEKDIRGNSKYVVTTKRLLKEKNWKEVRDINEKLLQNDQHDPLAIYLLAQAYLLNGEHARARDYFVQAKELDLQRIRVLEILNEIVREASRKDGVYLLDLDRIFRDNAKNGIVDFELIADNCHPSLHGSFLIAQNILQAMDENKIINNEKNMPLSEISLQWFLNDIGFWEDKSGLRKKYLSNIASYCTERDPVIFNYAAVRDHLKELALIEPDNWETWLHLAIASFFEGEIAQGKKELNKAAELHRGLSVFYENENLKKSLETVDLKLDDVL